ncbi:hypothetical protein IW967_06150 [Alicyclobacillus mali]|uniref:Membrane protein YkvI n=1 Tax=Alicyclobacillus mali (ex Roth et al. 2021) TaxID=1123961 RepID=A0ABS0F2E0_9BACL|nr:hypothetical protein [Alicyclobacillus mali (ex Roth et al. 2021)]MBF8377456.1 hypothetical protein [Alicyclobacillus mali (ex Roth et al. 2021)]MCL6487424.1 hypothetical protein [Alicyclobacillus mali (ex Roth et al. 2021)]
MRAVRLAFQIAAVYIGTVVGAGFASGQEVYQFFGRFGAWGFLGICVATGLFAWWGYRLLELGAECRARSFQDVTARALPRWLARGIDALVIAMLLGTTTAMLAGTGALFREQLGLPYGLGVLCAMAFAAMTTAFGIRGLFGANAVIVPALCIFAVGLALASVSDPSHRSAILHLHTANGSIASAILSALLYAAMNVGLSIGVLVPLGGRIGERRALRQGSALGAVGLGCLLAAVTITLAAHAPDAYRYAVPMGRIAATYPRVVAVLFIAVLFGEIYSTLVGNLYGLLGERLATQKKRLAAAGMVLATCAAFTAFGFRAIVQYGYTAFGWIALWLLTLLTLARRPLKLP